MEDPNVPSTWMSRGWSCRLSSTQKVVYETGADLFGWHLMLRPEREDLEFVEWNCELFYLITDRNVNRNYVHSALLAL